MIVAQDEDTRRHNATQGHRPLVLSRCAEISISVSCLAAGPIHVLRVVQTRAEDAGVTAASRDVLSPREVAQRAGFSYHAILRAIRRGDLQAFEPVAGHYRIDLTEYERWLRRPARRDPGPPQPAEARRPRVNTNPSERGSFARLRAIGSRGPAS